MKKAKSSKSNGKYGRKREDKYNDSRIQEISDAAFNKIDSKYLFASNYGNRVFASV